MNSFTYQRLNKCGIYTIFDLLLHFPLRYLNKTRVTAIADTVIDDYAVIYGRIQKVELTEGKRPQLKCFVGDNSGSICLRFFHFHKAQMGQLKQAEYLRACGEITAFSEQKQMVHPEFQLFKEASVCPVDEALSPIYPSTDGLTQRKLKQLISTCLKQYALQIEQLEWMPEAWRIEHNLPHFKEALSQIHYPTPDIPILELESKKHPIIQRIVIDELMAQRISMHCARKERAKLLAPQFQNTQILTNFYQLLPYSLTKGQQQAIEDIKQDVTTAKPMLRLIQGDVGSGKTTIAVASALLAIENGYQVALVTPTDLLSEQHYNTIAPQLAQLNLIALRLTGKMKKSEKQSVQKNLIGHQCHLLIGTHALLQDTVLFAKLGLVIIDEQHRFGVVQRLSLLQNNRRDNCVPHQLLMTATPIPRSLAMTQYGHIDISIVKDLPPGRIPIQTSVFPEDKRDTLIEKLAQHLQNGHQAYWVCTLIDESEKLQCQAATLITENLKQLLPTLQIELIHGRMKPQEKEQIMQAFKANTIHMLVATTVIEVGVDVPNANLMIIENAERLGLSQLHQLRGRVGRGHAQAYCLLLYQAPLSVNAAERLKIMKETTNGFLIAEKDLSLRGSGEFLGKKQTGYKLFKVADFARDQSLFPLVNQLTEQLLQQEPQVAQQLASRWLGAIESFLQS